MPSGEGVDGLEVRVRVELSYKGRTVVDETLGLALLLVRERGSLLAASRALGIPYSRLWERLSRAERILGTSLVRARRGGRGGGGAELTEDGLRVLREFLRAYEEVHGSKPRLPHVESEDGERLVYAGSNDPLLQRILGALMDKGVRVEAYWLGSLRGLASLLLGDADIAGLHLADPATGEYNVSMLRGPVEAGHLALLRGYQRRIGFVSRRPLRVSEIIDGILNGRLSIVNRPPGSGSRLLLERILLGELEGRGSKPGPGVLEDIVRGWDKIAKTHVEVAEAVARGEADTGVAVEPAARLYGLHFTPLAWEWFDFLIPSWPPKGVVEEFLGILCSKGLEELAASLPGYRVGGNRCRRLL
jgi:putative molybdopterin biosynthesis protein